ncbi:hypothetical protein [Methylobacterium sp. Leaf117]|uniref:type II toxin-antitoxin system RelB family antitoxin n=1 Tax=Methylobacterium sp. Leaf117 TaxID=1736260 RepID=UPI001FCCD9B2|nr:hypothetical protein [Methylobacterium sp. Leaf117]
MLALRRPPEIEDRLKALARHTGRSKDDHARDAILEHFENFAHLENLKAAEQHPAAVRSGESDTIASRRPAVALGRGGSRSRVPWNANSPSSTVRRSGASWAFCATGSRHWTIRVPLAKP